MFQQRRSDPNIKFSSSYPSSINNISGSLVTDTRQLVFPSEFSGYKTCKASDAAGSEYDDSDRKTQLAETEIDNMMESLCLSVTEHALGLDK